MPVTQVLGLDPGKQGGGARICCVLDGWETFAFEKLSKSELCRTLEHCLEEAEGELFAYLEDPTGPKPGKRTPKGIEGPALSFGLLEGMLLALRIPFETVRPQKWQRPFRLPTRKAVGDTAKKRAHRERAAELFPTAKPTNATADALLIAEYGRRLRAGEL